MIFALTNSADFTQTIDEQYYGKYSCHDIKACTSLFLNLVLVSLLTPIPYTGHFHNPVKHVNILP